MQSFPSDVIEFPDATVHADLSSAQLIEMALARKEGVLAANGALNCKTGNHTIIANNHQNYRSYED